MRKRRVILKREELENVFIKLLAGRHYSLAEIARPLGLSLREALDLEKQLKEEVLLERDLNELKKMVKNGN
jgi:hypothetical protein